MIHVGSSVLVTENLSNGSKYDFTIFGSAISNGGKYSFTEGKKGIVVSVDESSTYPYRVRFDGLAKYFGSEVLDFKKQDLKLI